MVWSINIWGKHIPKNQKVSPANLKVSPSPPLTNNGRIYTHVPPPSTAPPCLNPMHGCQCGTTSASITNISLILVSLLQVQTSPGPWSPPQHCYCPLAANWLIIDTKHFTSHFQDNNNNLSSYKYRNTGSISITVFNGYL